ncbi:MAG: prepilin-type N-terminal cleavage/methylation domain-containing protein [Desulfuromonadaceae bacterium]|nr:prepilin-type N-terminal cleavage/methylation domain-containing protein [Desulfuromonadaceae bacterium]
MGQNARLNNQSGFTLIEFCVAVLIMMVGLLGLLQAVNLAAEQNLGTVIRNEAVAVADELMLEVKNNPALTPPSTVTRRVRNGNFVFTINQQQTVVSANSKEVIIRVSWTYKNKTLNHQISSLITQP